LLIALFSTAYAIYFDHRRRTDPDFRRALKRESRRQARIAREEAEIQGKEQQERIKRAVEETLEEGFPTDLEEREAFFMEQIADGERMSADGRGIILSFLLNSNTDTFLQVQIQSAPPYASTKVSKFTQNREPSSESTTTPCQRRCWRSWLRWWLKIRT